MNHIDTHNHSLTARRALIHNHASLNMALDRLSTGLRVNFRGDGPITSKTPRASQRAIAPLMGPIAGSRDQHDGCPKNKPSTTDTLKVVCENVAAAEITNHDADFVRRTAALTRAQILANTTATNPHMAIVQPEGPLALREFLTHPAAAPIE